jgi:hypothetical protein
MNPIIPIGHSSQRFQRTAPPSHPPRPPIQEHLHLLDSVSSTWPNYLPKTGRSVLPPPPAPLSQLYDPYIGREVPLGALDLQQMLGRAGRPQYDTHGEGVVLVAAPRLAEYVALAAAAMPIESRLPEALPAHLCAEVEARRRYPVAIR